MADDQHGWWDRLGGPNAISLPAWLLTLPGAIFSTLAVIPEGAHARFGAWQLLGGLGHVVSGLVLFVAWRTVLSPRPRRPRPKTFVVVVLIAGLARGLFLAFTAVQFGLSEGLHLGLRLTGAPLSLLLWYSLATLIVDESRRHRQTMATIAQQVAHERRLAEQSAEVVRELRGAVVNATAETISTQLQGAISLSADPPAAARELRQVIDQVVRPLSHLLAESGPDEDTILWQADEHVPSVRVPFSSYVVGTFTAKPFAPYLTTVIVLGSGAFITLAMVGALAGALALATSALWIIGCLVAARRFVAPRLPTWPLAVRIATVFSIWLVVAIGDALMIVGEVTALAAWPATWPDTWPENWPGSGAVAQSSSLLATSVLILSTQLAVAIHGAVTVQRDRSEADLRRAAASAEWAAARLRMLAWSERHELGRVLHGDAQARLVSLALQLQLDPPADPKAAIAQVVEDIRSALNERHSAPWTESLGGIRRLWEDAIDLTWTVDRHAREALEADPLGAEAVAEVLREGITNAVLHGGADEVAVSVRGYAGMLDVIITDDGSGPPPITAAGMGTRLLDSVCLDWSITAGQPTRLHARLPGTGPTVGRDLTRKGEQA